MTYTVIYKPSGWRLLIDGHIASFARTTKLARLVNLRLRGRDYCDHIDPCLTIAQAFFDVAGIRDFAWCIQKIEFDNSLCATFITFKNLPDDRL